MSSFDQIITVCLNPAIDRILEVPDFALGRHQRGRQVSRRPAGKAINVSRALDTMAVASVVTGFVGRNELELFETSIGSDHTQGQLLAVDGATRENVTIVDPAARQETHIRDVGFSVTASDLNRLKRKLHVMCKPTSLVIFSGSMPPGVEPSDLVDLLHVCLRAEAKVAVDSSGPALRAAGELPLWLTKPNVAELAEMVGHPVESDEQILASGRQLSKHIRGVLVSRGEAGGYAFVDGSAMIGQVPVDRSRIVNTVGCGDAMLAGFVAAQRKGKDVRESYRVALAVATAAALTREPGQFELHDFQELVRVAAVEPVE